MLADLFHERPLIWPLLVLVTALPGLAGRRVALRDRIAADRTGARRPVSAVSAGSGEEVRGLKGLPAGEGALTDNRRERPGSRGSRTRDHPDRDQEHDGTARIAVTVFVPEACTRRRNGHAGGDGTNRIRGRRGAKLLHSARSRPREDRGRATLGV